MAAHVHKELIDWWSSDPENNIVECKSGSSGVWYECIDKHPFWYPDIEYRKKPQPPKPRHHQKIAEVYYSDDSLRLEVLGQGCVWFPFAGLVLSMFMTYRLLNQEGEVVCISLGTPEGISNG